MPAFVYGGRVGNSARRIWNTSLSTAISDSSTGSTPRRDQARPVMQLLQLGLRRPLGCSPVGFANRSCLTSPSCGILDAWPNYRGCDLSIRRSGSTFKALRISQLCTLSRSVTAIPSPWVGMVDLTPQASSKHPKLKYETLQISGDLVNFQNAKLPCMNVKPPY